MFNINLTTTLIIMVMAMAVMALAAVLLCLSWRLKDLKLKKGVTELAKSKGYKLDLLKMKARRPDPPFYNDNCTVVVSGVALVV